MPKKFKIGDKVQMTPNAVQNYGEKYEDVIFTVETSAYSIAQHPGYDYSVFPDGLHNLKFLDGKPLGCSLYDYELTQVE